MKQQQVGSGNELESSGRGPGMGGNDGEMEATSGARGRTGSEEVGGAREREPEDERSIFSWEQGGGVEPWPEPVEGAALLDALTGFLKRYVVLVEFAGETLALWVLHTYGFRLRDVTTYIGLESPQKRCGKTTLLTVLSEVVNRPVVASNISSPAFFRVIEETRPTLMIDEADTVLHRNDELRGILNSGHKRKTAYVVRVANEVRTSERDGRSDGCKEAPAAAAGTVNGGKGDRGRHGALRKGGGTRLVLCNMLHFVY